MRRAGRVVTSWAPRRAKCRKRRGPRVRKIANRRRRRSVFRAKVSHFDCSRAGARGERARRIIIEALCVVQARTQERTFRHQDSHPRELRRRGVVLTVLH